METLFKLTFNTEIPDFTESIRSLKLKIIGPEKIKNLKNIHQNYLNNPIAKAVCRYIAFEKTDTDVLKCEDIFFKSKTLAEKTTDSDICLVFLMSCITDKSDLMYSSDDIIPRLYADELCFLNMQQAMVQLKTFAEKKLGNTICCLNPGSVPDWCVKDQIKILNLLEPLAGEEGFSVNDSGMIYPLRSISGICFSSKENLESCDFCAKNSCPWRRSPKNIR